jgi:hypothetical protein
VNRDELERLGPDRVRLLLEAGYFSELDRKAGEERAAHDKRRT